MLFMCVFSDIYDVEFLTKFCERFVKLCILEISFFLSLMLSKFYNFFWSIWCEIVIKYIFIEVSMRSYIDILIEVFLGVKSCLSFCCMLGVTCKCSLVRVEKKYRVLKGTQTNDERYALPWCIMSSFFGCGLLNGVMFEWCRCGALYPL